MLQNSIRCFLELKNNKDLILIRLQKNINPYLFHINFIYEIVNQSRFQSS